MSLSQLNKTALYRRFPKVELSYEVTAHKKVHNADMYLAIPSKNKCFAWFTYFQDKRVCFVLNIVNDRLQGIRAYPCCFDARLALGTVLYGSMVTTADDRAVFCAEDILQWEGRHVDRQPWDRRVGHLAQCMRSIKPLVLSKDFLLVSAALFSQDFKELELFIENSVYDVDYIQARGVSHQKFENFSIKQFRRRERSALPTAVFSVRPNLRTDIYELYCFSGTATFHNVAHIPTYKTSVMMNSIFRNIRENARLDALEESEDEDEFENVAEDKFVDLGVERTMRCVYSYRFRRWVPREVVESGTKLVTAQELKALEKKN